MTHVSSMLLGLGNGGVFAALAIALVLTYRSSGVVNFATGSMALYTAYTYAWLRNGQLLILIPGLPTSVSVGGPLPSSLRRLSRLRSRRPSGRCCTRLCFVRFDKLPNLLVRWPPSACSSSCRDSSKIGLARHR